MGNYNNRKLACYSIEDKVNDDLYVSIIKEFGDNTTTVDKSPTAFLNTRDQIFFGVIFISPLGPSFVLNNVICENELIFL